MRRCATLVVVCMVISAFGCNSMRPVDLRASGSMVQKQIDAHQFDPYVDNQSGPAVVGGRPRGFDSPPSLSYQGRWQTVGGSWWDRRGF